MVNTGTQADADRGREQPARSPIRRAVCSTTSRSPALIQKRSIQFQSRIFIRDHIDGLKNRMARRFSRMPRSWCRNLNGRFGWTTSKWGRRRRGTPLLSQCPAHLQGHGHGGAAVQAGRRGCLGSFPSLPMAIRRATPLSPFIQAMSPCWRMPIPALIRPVRAQSRIAADLRHGKRPQAVAALTSNARSRRRRPYAGPGLPFPLPSLRPHDQDLDRLRACAGRVAAVVR